MVKLAPSSVTKITISRMMGCLMNSIEFLRKTHDTTEHCPAICLEEIKKTIQEPTQDISDVLAAI
jgi:hypothetical protein